MKQKTVEEPSKLFFREWVAVFFVLCLGIFLALSNWGECKLHFFKAQDSLSKEFVERKKIQVEVSGAVGRPGVYEVDSGVSLKFVLGKACVLSRADKKSLYSKKVLLESCQVHVPEKISRKREKRK